MPARWKKDDRPPSVAAFLDQFPDDDACARYLERRRWSQGFVCPGCGSCKGWRLETKRWTWECRDCGRQTSVTAGTVMHGSHVSLRNWFLAAHLMVTHSNGISALQLQAKLDLGSYKTAWLMLHKLRRAMANPTRLPLWGIVEVDETTIPYRTSSDPVAGGQGRSHVGKLAVVGAVEITQDGHPRRIRLEVVKDYGGATLKGFIRRNVMPKSAVVTDGLSSYDGLDGYLHVPRVVGKMAAHVALPWIHRVFSNLKRWGLGVFHGFRKKYLNAYLTEFVFRWNRRNYYPEAFDMLVGIGLVVGKATRADIMAKAA
jgi:transposase-like protein/predicted RNA-binding Zn-ribbon protein involved in translation (DUF1610 family)